MKNLKYIGVVVFWLCAIFSVQMISSYLVDCDSSSTSVISTQIILLVGSYYVFFIDYFKKYVNKILNMFISFACAFISSFVGGYIMAFIYC